MYFYQDGRTFLSGKGPGTTFIVCGTEFLPLLNRYHVQVELPLACHTATSCTDVVPGGRICIQVSYNLWGALPENTEH